MQLHVCAFGNVYPYHNILIHNGQQQFKGNYFPVGFEPTISAAVQPQTLDRAATGTGTFTLIYLSETRKK
jgi:hypothetical protein